MANEMNGKILGGYRIIEQVGMGGMATVYKAYDPHTDRHVAIKVLPQQYAADPEFLARFAQEAKAIARLEHIHILPVFAYGEQDNITYMVMRYMDAGTLADLISQGPMRFEQASHFIKQLASALDYAHLQGVIHRDVKPSNALVDNQGNVFLTDFGIAKMIGTGSALTQTGALIGTPQYMAPEQFMDSAQASAASDQYALGVILYEMLTGRTPFKAETPWAIIGMHQRGDSLPLPINYRDDIPEAATNVLLKVLSVDPASRYVSCMAMALAFEKAITGDTLPKTKSSTPEPAKLTDMPTMIPGQKPSRTVPDTATQAIAKTDLYKPSPFLRPLYVGAGVLLLFLLLIGGALLLLSVLNQSSAPADVAIAMETTVGQLHTEVAPSVEAVLAVQTTQIIESTLSTVSTEINTPSTDAPPLEESDDTALDAVDSDPTRLFLTESAADASTMTSVALAELDAQATVDAEATLFMLTDTAADALTMTSVALAELDLEMTEGAIGDPFSVTQTSEAQANAGNEATPDGRRVMAEPLPAADMLDLEVCDEGGSSALCQLNNGEFKVLVPLDGFDPDYVEGYTWSQDGQFVALSLRPEASDSNAIYLYDIALDTLTQLTFDFYASDPSISPQGIGMTMIYDERLAMMNIYNGDTHFLSEEAENHCLYYPQWSPDGEEIAVIVREATEGDCYENDSIQELRIYSSDGNYTQVLREEGLAGELCDEFAIAFSPDGQSLAYLDIDCQPMLYNRQDQSYIGLIEFPYWWTSEVYPQWSSEAQANAGDEATPDGRRVMAEPLPAAAGLIIKSLPRIGQQELPEFSGKVIYVASAATIEGDGSAESPYQTIQEAIHQAEAGDFIVIAQGHYHEHDLLIDKNLILQGGYDDQDWSIHDSDPLSTTLDANGVGIGLRITGEKVILDGFSIINGYNDCAENRGGAGLQVDGANLTLTRMLIAYHYAESPCGGAGIEAFNNAHLLISNSFIGLNQAAAGGAGILIVHDASASILFSTIASNDVGGILLLQAGDETVRLVNSILWNTQDLTIEGSADAYEQLHSLVGQDPLFADVAQFDYRLLADSPAIGAAGLPRIEIDMLGHARHRKTDLGAWQYQEE